MTVPRHRSLTMLAIVIGIGGPVAVRFAKAHGYVANYQGLLWGTVALGAACVVGALLAYRMTRDQVRQDRKEIGLDG